MTTRRIDESSLVLGATSWAAIASGVFLALALQATLMLFGLAVATSTGDRVVGGGYSAWAVIVQLVSIGVGAALGARMAHAGRRLGGIAAGVMIWAVALALGGALQGIAMLRVDATGAAWAAFLGAVFGLGAAMLGGAFGASMGRRTTGPMATPHPDAPSHAPA